LIQKKTAASNPVIAWTSKIKTHPFIQKLDTGFGLIGMDIMAHWKSVAFASGSKGLKIKIVI
jgi:hypothetical protein